MAVPSTLNIAEATIDQLLQAISSRATTSVELTTLFLHRIGRYDFRGPSLNSICVLNPDVLAEAQASDDYRASGLPPRPLEGIPFTVKDSYCTKGLAVAAASPAFADLIASSDAAVVASLRAAGAILLGRTNMPPMADGGSQRGHYGRAESPYNQTYMCTSYASGSSSGSGVATTAGFAPIGLGSETVSSGRAPASINSIVGYSPSRGVIPSRGVWPLYPTCDVLTPHTKSVEDLLAVLNVIVADEPTPQGDFWREQKTIQIPKSSEVRPKNFLSLMDSSSLKGKRLAVPRCFIGKDAVAGKAAAAFADSMNTLWLRAKADLEALGASVTETDFPLVENYTKQHFPGQAAYVPDMPDGWIDIERCQMIALGWDDFLRANNATTCKTLTSVDHEKIRPFYAPLDDPRKHTEVQNHVRYPDMIEYVRHRPASIHDLPGCAEALRSLEAARKRDLEAWLDEHGFDALVFPTNGDVARADAEEVLASMQHALRDGVKYSNGARALKHMGVPAVTVPMGDMADKKMPAGLTFAGRAWGDSDLLRYAFAYETATRRRTSPPLAPGLPSDLLPNITGAVASSGDMQALTLTADVVDVQAEVVEGTEVRNVRLQGTVSSDSPSTTTQSIEVFTNGEPSSPVQMKGGRWEWQARLERPQRNERYPSGGQIPRDQFMIVVVAKASIGRSTALMRLVD
ncbi:hypothetical protein ACHAQA_009833 [Verticillium albo-atrum]